MVGKAICPVSRTGGLRRIFAKKGRTFWKSYSCGLEMQHPLIHRGFRIFPKLIPSGLAGLPIPLPIGERVVVAERPAGEGSR